MTDLSRNEFTGTDGSQVFTDEIPGVTWTSALTNAQIDTDQYVSPPSSVLISAGVSGSSQPQIAARGWEPSPHDTSGGAEAFVRWNDIDEGWGKVAVLSSAATVTLSMAINFAGQITVEYRNVSAFTAANLTVVNVTINQWYHMAIQWDVSAGGGNIFYQFEGSRVGTISTSPLSNMSLGLLSNIGTSGAVWYDRWRLYPGVEYGVTYDIPTFAYAPDIDSAEFDYEVTTVPIVHVINLTQFSDDGNTDICRRIVVPECIRRTLAKHACRRLTAKPTVH